MSSVKRQSSNLVTGDNVSADSTELKKAKMNTNMNLLSIHDNITKSTSDRRQYHGFQLNNKMKVMVISDPETDMSAASMDVHIGSFSDPKNIPGLAHFLEHMLFMGTEKYPEEDDYSKFISQNAGGCNAWTSGEHTNYYFDIKKEKLSEILDRFAQFFISPLFDESGADREVNAVQSEHEKNVMSDGWRVNQIDKENSDPTHDYAKFGTGTKETLQTIPVKQGLNVREELLKFHRQYYSSNIMSLAVIGAESVEQLKSMVVDMFSLVTNKDVTVPYYLNSPYREQDLQIKMEIVPVKDVRFMTMNFPVQNYNTKEGYKTNPVNYVSHLIGHEGEGSLLSSLKKRGLVNQLSAGEDEECRGFAFFQISCDLTEEGVGRTDEILEITFQYINMLRRNRPEERIFNEIRDIHAMAFAFKDKETPESCVLNITEAMHQYPMEDVLTATNLVFDFDPDLIEQFLTYLAPKNLRVTICSKSCEKKADKSERWYGTKYHVEKINPDLIEKWTNAPQHQEHHLPRTNEFIATNFDLAQPDPNHSQVPYLLKETSLSRVWFKQDDHFKLPKSILKFRIKSPIAYSSPDNTNMVHLFVDLFNDSLNEYAYDAEVAGLRYKLHRSVYGLELEVRGYNEKQIVLLEKIITKLAQFQINPKRFKIYKEKLTRALKNFAANQPHSHVAYYSNALRTDKFWSNDQLLPSLKNIRVELLQNFIQEFLANLHVESLMHGNITPQEAIRIIELVEKILTDVSKTSAQQDQEQLHAMKIEPGKSYVYKSHHKVRELSATQVYYLIGEQNRENVNLLRLLVQIIEDPCFNILRTKEQLGYIVSSSSSRVNSVCGLSMLVQSKKSPEYLDGRIEAFVHSIQGILDDMKPAEFQEHVESLLTRILEKPKKLATETSKYWAEIGTQHYQFERDDNDAAFLRNVTKDDVTAFYKRFVRIDAPQRSKLAVYVLGKQLDGCDEAPGDISQLDEASLKTPPLPKVEIITGIDEWKEGREVYPRIAPYIDIHLPITTK